jgi:glyoxylase-like metal-dependent hydrolase (beta-lactamase superfamily II)
MLNEIPPHDLKPRIRTSLPLGDTLPGPAQTLEVAPGVKWIRMTLPFALDHINLWLLRDRQTDLHGQVREGWTVIDCCVNRTEAREQWEQIFASALEGLPILRVIVTHMHPDHIGLAGWLCHQWNAPLWISATDYNVARVAMKDRDGFGGESGADFYSLHGQRDEEFLLHARPRQLLLFPGSPHPRHLSPHHGWRRDRHQRPHMAMHCRLWSRAGAHGALLRRARDTDQRRHGAARISANVSVHSSEPEANPLQLFLTSLKRYFALPRTPVLPSHGKPFTGLHTRVQQLLDHHQERLNDIMQASRRG